MCYGIDIVPDALIKYAIENSLAVYYNAEFLCSVTDSEDGHSDEADGSDEVADGDDSKTRIDVLNIDNITLTDSSHGHDDTAVISRLAEEDEDEDDEDGGAVLDHVASMRAALRAIAEEKRIGLPAFANIQCGVQRSTRRASSLIISFYTNYDLQRAERLPSVEDIEKLRTSLGSEHPAGWYLDSNNATWEYYALDI